MAPLTRLGLATRNLHKVEEIRAFLQERGWTVELVHAGNLPAPGPEETGSTFRENACIKALYYEPRFGCPTFGEDSGLVVPALQGFPGLHSARWGAGRMTQEEKNGHLVEAVRGFPPEKRRAFFVCAAAYVVQGRVLWSTEVRVEGRIASAPAGEGGFGYDPIFLLPELNRTMAQLSRAEKNRYSHRGRALDEWLKWMENRTHGT